MQDLAKVAHIVVDLSVLPEPAATDDTGLYVFQLQHNNILCVL